VGFVDEFLDRFYVDQTSPPSRDPQIPSCESREVLHKFVVVLIVVMTELNRSKIAMGFSWLTDLVFYRAYAIVRGINRPTRGQEREMSIPRRAIIRKCT